MLKKAFVDSYCRVKSIMPTRCPKGMLHVKLKKSSLFSYCCCLKLNLAYRYNLHVSRPVCTSIFDWKDKLASMYWRDFCVVSSAFVLLHVWSTPLQSIDQAIWGWISDIFGFSGATFRLRIDVLRSVLLLVYKSSCYSDLYGEKLGEQGRNWGVGVAEVMVDGFQLRRSSQLYVQPGVWAL